jgi:hypothetical protein
MSRIYTVPYQGTVTAAGGDTELFELVPAAGKQIRLRGLKLSQWSEVGDAQEEGLRISILRMTATVTVGSGGSAVTPVPVHGNDPASGFSARSNDTTVATTSGSTTIIEEFAWNVRNSPFETWWPDGDFAPDAKNAEYLIVRMQTTLADDASFAITAYVEEF